jgi:hypothetical protein
MMTLKPLSSKTLFGLKEPYRLEQQPKPETEPNFECYYQSDQKLLVEEHQPLRSLGSS